MSQIVTMFNSVITMAGSLVTALFGSEGALADLVPYLLIGVAFSAFLFIILGVKRMIWGA